jgi:hypothetical protein
MPRRRPSPSLVIALIALFVALGGPAHAARLVSGKDIRKNAISAKHIRSGQVQTRHVRDRTLRVNDLAATTVAELRFIADGSLVGAKLAGGTIGSREVADQSLQGVDIAPNAISSDEIREGSVGASEISDGSIDAGEVVDGSLAAKDVASFAGTVEPDFGAVAAGACKTADIVVSQIAGSGNRSLSDDAIAVTTPYDWSTTALILSASPAGEKTIRLRVCNFATAELNAGKRLVRYAAFDL